VLHPVELAGQVLPVERARVEEPQCRDGHVHRRHTEARPALLDLVPPQVLVGRQIGRAAQPVREPGHIAQIVVLRCPGQPVQVHVIDEALEQRRGGIDGRGVGHR
jgi:hypothetical protein